MFYGRPLLLAAVLVLAVAGAATAAVHEVEIRNFAFDPAELQIVQGDTVHWTSFDAISHTVTSGSDCTADGLFDSGLFGQAGEFSFTFTEQGTVPYFCIPHCPGMEATIVVGANTATDVQTWGKIRSLYR